MNDTTRPTSISRTWAIVCFDRYEPDDSIVDRHVHLVTLTADASGKLSALVDLEETTLDRAVMLLRWAKTDGTYEQIEEVRLPEPEPVAAAPIGNPTARSLHIELGRLGYRTSASHYEVAAAVLGRAVTSLATLTAEEAALTRSFAYGQLGLETGSVAA